MKNNGWAAVFASFFIFSDWSLETGDWNEKMLSLNASVPR